MSGGHFEAVVIGGGQAGLAMGSLLKARGRSFVIFDAAARIGESWRARWDSLRLFTPARFNGLPGVPFPGAAFSFPTKDQVAAYLEDYAARLRLPVVTSTRVQKLSRDGSKLRLEAGRRVYTADNVVVATGPYSRGYVPEVASSLDKSIVQLHSSEYRNPRQIPRGPVLVVGAGNSGAEIAIELSRAGRRVLLSGRPTGKVHAASLGRLFGGEPYWWVISRLLSEGTPIGRRIKGAVTTRGTPLIGAQERDIAEAGVERGPRTTAVSGGRPCLADGRVLDVAAVVWATGYRPDYGWIDLPAFDQAGHPVHKRGVAESVPGLYFLGLPFQHSLASSLLGGVGEDAAYVDAHMGRRSAGKRRS